MAACALVMMDMFVLDVGKNEITSALEARSTVGMFDNVLRTLYYIGVLFPGAMIMMSSSCALLEASSMDRVEVLKDKKQYNLYFHGVYTAPFCVLVSIHLAVYVQRTETFRSFS